MAVMSERRHVITVSMKLCDSDVDDFIQYVLKSNRIMIQRGVNTCIIRPQYDSIKYAYNHNI